MKNKDSKESKLPKEQEAMADPVVHIDVEDDENMDTDDQDFPEDDDESFSSPQPPLSQFGRYIKEMKIMNSGQVPNSGYNIPSGQLKAADEFYTLKILTVKDASEETQDDKQGKMLLHTEHSLLSFLNGQPGIIREHGLFEDYACDGVYNQDSRSLVSNGKVVRRLCLALDCVIPHSFSSTSSDYINLQHYVIGKRKLKELDALVIFYNIVYVVKNLHDLNVIHRDLKLANLVLDKRNRQITLTNFCLGQHLVSADDKLLDQRGSPAYISPDVLSGKPYLGKPSDMWALGVVLYTMLYGQFPFYHKHHQELFKLIKAVQYSIPNDGGVKSDTLEIIQSLLSLDPLKRATASQVLTKLTSVIAKRLTPETVASHDAQVVPDVDGDDDEEDEDLDSDDKKKKRKYSSMEDDEEINPYEKDPYNILDILEASNSNPSSSLDKKNSVLFPIPSRSSTNYCFTTVPKEIIDQGKKKNTISIIEGDLRTFTQADLYTHRSIFSTI
ncbi:Serine/threonine-protein kinase 40 [Armadillidium nasatum]|uniref:Serine/threonine-protein kinase 40 n=1 Tax=Armadillidium nasatum TaxID=96803 RepID=A0A5N5TPI3_9CRUS|nr:Serine/threonine-protein kinase 40 [Armadillidium nasatum]